MYRLLRSGLPRIAVCASGNGSNFEAIAQAVNSNKLKAKIEALIVDRECFAIERAKRLNIDHIKLSKPWYNDFQEVINRLDPDIIVLAGFMRIIPREIVSNFFPKIVNIHPSLLPAFPGKDAIKQAYEYGVRVTGITVHLVDAGIDTGPIIFQKSLENDPSWTLQELEERIHSLEHEYYWQVISDLIYKPFKIEGRRFTWGE